MGRWVGGDRKVSEMHGTIQLQWCFNKTLKIVLIICIYCSWYFGPLSREETNDILMDKEPGTFLVRDSQSIQGDFVLCVRWEPFNPCLLINHMMYILKNKKTHESTFTLHVVHSSLFLKIVIAVYFLIYCVDKYLHIFLCICSSDWLKDKVKREKEIFTWVYKFNIISGKKE